MNDEANTQQREKRHAALYFSAKNSAAFKELAARIRSDGGRTTLVWAKQWKGAESILTECRAIVIEEGCVNADDIVEAYRRYGQDVEVHYADENGEFASDHVEAETDEQREANADSEAAASREERGATKEEDEAALAAEVGATPDEEEHDDSDATSDTVVPTEDGGTGDDPVDPDSEGGDAGTEDDGAEASDEKPTDSS